MRISKKLSLSIAVFVTSACLIMAILPFSQAEAASGAKPSRQIHYATGDGARLSSASALGVSVRSRGAAWTTALREKGARGAWVRWIAPSPRVVNRVQIVGAGSGRRLVAGVIRFSDGSRLRVRTNAAGDLDVRFAERTARTAVLIVDEAASKDAVVALRRWVLAKDARPGSSPGPAPVRSGPPEQSQPTPTSAPTSSQAAVEPSSAVGALGSAPDGLTSTSPGVSSTPSQAVPGVTPQAGSGVTVSTGGSPTRAQVAADVSAMSASGDANAALTDARKLLPQSTGTSWTAPAVGSAAVTFVWPSPERIDALQLYGSPTKSGAAKSGTIQFADGSSVRLNPVPGGGARPVTVAFPARIVQELTVRLEPASSSPIQLREIAAFGPGGLPPTGTSSGGSVSTVGSASCDSATASASTKLQLVCPKTGMTLSSRSIVVASGPEGAQVTARSELAAGGQAVISRATVSGGTARLAFDATQLPGGPVTIQLSAPGAPRSLYAQFVNASRSFDDSTASAGPQGRSLVFNDDFDGPLSASATGVGATYAATKPTSWGNSEFGSAIFVDPVRSPENLSTSGDGYLRIRTTPLAAGETDPAGWGRTYKGGIISSASALGGGFAAQYGYFEARVLAPASPGTWPAFWMMSGGFLRDSQSAANSEVDAFELYGQDPSYSCHAWHDWVGVASQQASGGVCPHAIPNWAMAWHTYGVDISRTSTRYYIDGALVYSAPAVGNSADPFYFMLNLSLGGGWPIELGGVEGVADMYVDYVRVYV